MPKTNFVDAGGARHEVDLGIEMYREAMDAGLSLPQYLARRYETDADRYGATFDQMAAAAGLFMSPNREYGIRPPSLHAVLNGGVEVNMGSVVRPDGASANTLSGRYLFPAVVLELVESELREDRSNFAATFNRMVAQTISVSSPRYDQPIINLTGPRSSKSRPISQGALPPTMVSISLSERSQRMPTYSIGLEITDEAARASALDLVAIAVREQAMQERADNLEADLKAIVLGDVDVGQSALTTFNADTLDSTIAADGEITHKAWIKYLRKEWKRRTIDWTIMDVDTYLAVEARSGRPIKSTDDPSDARLNSLPTAANPGLLDRVNTFLLDDSSLLGANRIVGLDSSKAIRKIIYTGATYEAVEEFVMRRTKAFRFDWSERHERIFDQAFSVMDLVNT